MIALFLQVALGQPAVQAVDPGHVVQTSSWLLSESAYDTCIEKALKLGELETAARDGVSALAEAEEALLALEDALQLQEARSGELQAALQLSEVQRKSLARERRLLLIGSGVAVGLVGLEAWLLLAGR